MNFSCLYKAFCACCCLSEGCIQSYSPSNSHGISPSEALPKTLPNVSNIASDLKLVTVVSAEELNKVKEFVEKELKEVDLNPEKLAVELTEIVTPLEQEAKKVIEGMDKKIENESIKPFENYIKSYFT